MIAYPNEKPKFEYIVKVSPKIGSNTSQNTEYEIEIDYEIKDSNAQEEFTIEFESKSDELPKNGKIVLKLNGSSGESEVYNFSKKTESTESENKLLFKIKSKDIGEVIFHLSISYMYYFVF